MSDGVQITEKTVKELCDVAQLCVEIARRAGADDVEVVVRDGSELTTKIRMGEPELVQEAGSRGLGLRVIKGGRRATTHTSDLRRESLEALCAETVTLAGFAEPDEFSAPPDPSTLTKSYPELDLYDGKIAEVDAAWALKQAIAGEKAARGYSDKVTNSEGATWSRSLGASAMATSGGFVGGYRSSYASLVVEPLCDDMTEATPKKRNGYWWTGGRFLHELEDPELIGKEAARRTIATIGSRKVETQECAIIFNNEVARSIIGTLVGLANGGSFWRKQTYFVGREGTEVASKLISIVDDPHIPRAPGSRPFDGDGLATRKNVIVENGVLKTVLFDTYSARKMGRESTGSRAVGGNPGVTTSNVIMAKGSLTHDALVKDTKRGLYVTSMMGFGFNPITGDFSRGAAGFWIENGELTFPVSEVTIAANFDEILKRIDAVADDVDLRTSTVAPSFRVSHMTLAGLSK
ncbi:MAG TPA: metallopeptidase TldD-related protein [Kofleriaceae bacterium]|jgi:PmbA protein